MKIERFEDIRAWQEGRLLTKWAYQWGKESIRLRRDRRYAEQLQSASVSIMSNIAEGFSRRPSREFSQFLFVAKGSAAEVQSLLYVGLDQEYLTEAQFTEGYRMADDIARMLSGFITSLRKLNGRTTPSKQNR